jgi:hypothetical protein
MDLKNNEFIKKDEHYLNKYGFITIDKIQTITPASGVGVSTYSTNLRLAIDKSIWNIIIDSQRLQITNNQYRHISGRITNNEYLNDFKIKSKSNFLTFFLDSNKLSNFYEVQGNDLFKLKIQKVEKLLLELRDKNVEIKKINGELTFSFYFNSYFNDIYYDYVFDILREITF